MLKIWMQSCLPPNHIWLALLHVITTVLETGIFSPKAKDQIRLSSQLYDALRSRTRILVLSCWNNVKKLWSQRRGLIEKNRPPPPCLAGQMDPRTPPATSVESGPVWQQVEHFNSPWWLPSVLAVCCPSPILTFSCLSWGHPRQWHQRHSSPIVLLSWPLCWASCSSPIVQLIGIISTPQCSAKESCILYTIRFQLILIKKYMNAFSWP